MSINVQPTPKTAALAGAGAGFGLVPFELMTERLSPSTPLAENLLFLTTAALVLIPVYLFVLGKQEPVQPRGFFYIGHSAPQRACIKRMLVWFISAGFCGTVCSILRDLVF